MGSKPRQHWLPRTYLRPFCDGTRDTLFMLDLFKSPQWIEVGVNDVGNTRGYHARKDVDEKLDTTLLNGYPAVIAKIAGLRADAPLGTVLDRTEIEGLLALLDVHLLRNPLSSYRGLFHLVRMYLVENPETPLPDDLMVGFPRLYEALMALRQECDDGGPLGEADREHVALAWVHEKMEEDGVAHRLMSMPSEFDDVLLAQLTGPRIRSFSKHTVLYSATEIFTTDNPFVLSGSETGEAIQLAALTPHHLLVCSDGPLALGLHALDLLAGLPYYSFSTAILAARPIDLDLLWFPPLPAAVDTERTTLGEPPGTRIQLRLPNVPVRTKKTSPQ